MVVTIEKHDNGVVIRTGSPESTSQVYNYKDAAEALTEVFRACFPWGIGDKVIIQRTECSAKERLNAGI